MPFIDTTSPIKGNASAKGVASSQGVITPGIIAPSGQVTKALETTLTPENTRVTTDLSPGFGPGSIAQTISSAVSTFDKTVKGLSGSVDQTLSGLFKNTNNPAASNPITRTSDPVSTNIVNKQAPNSSSFKFGSLQSGSTKLTQAGATPVFGSGAASMTGNNLATLLNRVNLDIKAVASLPATVSGLFTTDRLNGLFSSLITGASRDVSNLTTDPYLKTLTTNGTSSALSGIIGINGPVSTSRDLQTFLGNNAALSASLGGADLSSYYVTNSDYSILNDKNVPVYTNQSGVDASTANAIVGLMKTAGCLIDGDFYASAAQQASAFNLGLNLASLTGMFNQLDSLLNCSFTSTTLGQQSLITAFTSSSNSQIDSLSQIVDHVHTPNVLNTDAINKSIMTNPDLTADDISKVDAIMAKIGSSTTNALSISTVSSDAYPVYDLSLIRNVQTPVTNAVFDDSTLSDFISGKVMAMDLSGQLVAI